MERFGRLRTEINKWEMLIKSQFISTDVINRQFISLSRVIQDLAKEDLLARVGPLSICMTLGRTVMYYYKSGYFSHIQGNRGPYKISFCKCAQESLNFAQPFDYI